MQDILLLNPNTNNYIWERKNTGSIGEYFLLKLTLKTLNELIRVSKDNAIIRIIVPHSTSYANFSDLQHKNNFTENTFCKDHLKEYELENLLPLKVKFLYRSSRNKWKKLVPFRKYIKVFFNGIYDEILFEFRVKKK